MSLTLAQRESVSTAVGHALRKRIQRTVALINDSLDDDAGAGIHEARKQIKQARALLQLLRLEMGHKECSRIERRLRQVARALSRARDATVLLERLQEIQRQALLSHASNARLRLALAACRKRASDRLATPRRRARLIESLRYARRQIAAWPAVHRGWKTLGPGLRDVYKAARAAAGVATQLGVADADALHKARKRAKNLLHVLEFLRKLRPRTLHRRIRVLHHFTDLLGRDHDLAVLAAYLQGPLHGELTPGELRRVLSAIAKIRLSLQLEATAVAENIYADSKVIFVKTLHRYWRQWRSTQAAGHSPAPQAASGR